MDGIGSASSGSDGIERPALEDAVAATAAAGRPGTSTPGRSGCRPGWSGRSGPRACSVARVKPRTRSLASSLIAVTPLAAPATTLASVTGKIRTRAALGGQADVLRSVGRLDVDDPVVRERRVEPDHRAPLAGRDRRQRGQANRSDLAAGRHRHRVRRRRQRGPVAARWRGRWRPWPLPFGRRRQFGLSLRLHRAVTASGRAVVGQAARVVADDADDVLLVLERELLLDRLAVAGRQRHVVGPHGVGDARDR